MSETEPSKPTPTRGVWGFMKRKVWGDVVSYPISDSGSESQRTETPEEADDPNASTASTASTAGPVPAASRSQSPFQSHQQTNSKENPDDDSLKNQPKGDNAVTNKASVLASELSLRHGLGEGIPCHAHITARSTYCTSWSHVAYSRV